MNRAHEDSGPCETEPSNNQDPEAYETMQIAPQTLKPKLTEPVVSATGSEGKKQPAVAATGGMTGGATGVTGGATARQLEVQRTLVRRMLDGTPNMKMTHSKKVKPSMSKMKNSTKSLKISVIYYI